MSRELAEMVNKMHISMLIPVKPACTLTLRLKRIRSRKWQTRASVRELPRDLSVTLA
jgi:hypothetical protein